ncbi:hypothetical protein SARC_09559 [Sphaeroforma arctica JP610]|uniref:Golgi apparatus membrane protein tvp38 n=1 Tax=Sphaeroforma arctica JP610 TaxID=667725 RepID=A0A0L0FPU0_9EUKA|nr:hypothetical protein SARC_09559 [Sphaeroforma arctica JP610]KNC77993.1 hypothetical protein SARC_09559 [Sphaeroforma arctica JP610]|eukprot:XP_014151895.1 hypothetical protein SARC_09559 [Sphaeroforma arctica JP610]
MVGFSPAVGTGVYALTFIASLLTLWMLYRNLPVLLIRYLKDKVHTQSSKVLFLDLLALRVIPFTPNWALNLCLPHLAVPLHIFASTVFIGLLPYNFICVEAGTMATNLRNPSDMIKDPSTLLRLCLVGLALMTPRIITKFSRYNRPTQPLL